MIRSVFDYKILKFLHHVDFVPRSNRSQAKHLSATFVNLKKFETHQCLVYISYELAKLHSKYLLQI